MKRISLLLVFVLSMLATHAQLVDKKVYDFGKVANWNCQPAIFNFTNNTNQRIVFLPSFPANDVLVQLPAKAVEPGAQSQIIIGYFTPDKGPFNRKVQIYTSASDKPMELTLKGDILSIAPSAFTSCPTVGPGDGKSKMPDQDILVIDKQTRQPIFGALLEMGRDNIQEIKTTTNRQGLITIKRYSGHYHMSVKKDGYVALDGEMILSPEMNRIILEMEKIDAPAVVATPTPQVPEVIDTMPYEDLSGIPDKDSSGELSSRKFGVNNIVFLVDVSNSMKTPNKLPLLKDAMKQLVTALRPIDKVTVIAYSSRIRVVVATTTVSDKTKISAQIDSLAAGGGTNGLVGLEGAYNAILANYQSGGNNQVIIATDGVFNGANDKGEQGVVKYIKDKSIEGITLSVVGFGDDPLAKKLMERMAQSGNGSFIQFSKDVDAGTLLVNEIKTRSKIRKHY